MADYKVTNTELTSVANAIRAKTGKSAQIEFPTEFVSEIGSISGGGGAFAFVRVLYLSGDTVSISDGTTTLTGDTSGDYVFAIPNSGTWTITTEFATKSIQVTEYGSAITVALRLDIIQNTFGVSEQIFQYSKEPITGNTTVTIHFITTENLAKCGIVFNCDSDIYKIKCTYASTSTINAQFGTCSSVATLPTIISQGTGRGSYSSSSGRTTNSKNSAYPHFFFGATIEAGVDFSLTIELIP